METHQTLFLFQIHGYASLFVCILGTIANLLNIVVLTRKEMRTPTNMILTGLAIADLLVMVDYVPFSYYMYLNKSKYTYSLAVFTLFHANFSQVCHTISIWLTVIIAVWRCIAIAYPQMNRVWCKMKNTVIVIIGTYIACPVVCIPQYFTYNLRCRTVRNETAYTVYSDGSVLLRDIHYWIYGFLMKLLPCVLLTILSLRLILALIKTKKRQKNLSNTGSKSKKQMNKEKKADRTTKMLLVVLLLFLITEFPQGILGLMNYSLGDVFLRNCYLPLGDLLDILALFNSGINFMIYCAMSRQFRITFRMLFAPKILKKCMPAVQHNNVETCMTQVTHV